MRKIEYLDGLRGIAAFVVVISHFVQIFYPALLKSEPNLIHNTFEPALSKTPVNLLYNGNFAVCIFFVLSGFVLSYKYFEQGQPEILVSSAVRRYFRLAIPAFVSVLTVYVLLLLNAFHYTDIVLQTRSYLPTDYRVMSHNFFTMARSVLYDCFFTGKPQYNPVLWTMSYELFGSFLVFTFLALFGKLTRRYLIYLFLIFFYGQTYFVAFILGLVLCDLHHNGTWRIGSKFRKAFLVPLSFAIGIFFGSYPYIDTRTTLYHYLDLPFITTDHLIFYHIWGAFFLMVALLNSSLFMTILSHRYALFLGKISFSLYLTHFTILSSLTSYIFSRCISTLSYNLSFLITFCISIPIMIFVSYLLTRFVDKPAIRVSYLIYQSVFRKCDSKPSESQAELAL